MALTGMQVGGVTPFALPAELPLYVDERIMQLDWIMSRSGGRAAKIKITPGVFTQLGATIVADLGSIELHLNSPRFCSSPSITNDPLKTIDSSRENSLEGNVLEKRRFSMSTLPNSPSYHWSAKLVNVIPGMCSARRSTRHGQSPHS